MSRTVLFQHLKKWTDQPPDECWLWEGPGYGKGYGGVRLEPPTERRAPRPIYRVMYELYRGTIPPGLQLDHLCRVRRCANPRHLEAVTCRENLRRGFGFVGDQMRRTHCPAGHPLSDDNVVRYKGHKQCRVCTLDRVRRAWGRNRLIRIEQGLCLRCGRPRDSGYRWCAACRAWTREAKRNEKHRG